MKLLYRYKEKEGLIKIITKSCKEIKFIQFSKIYLNKNSYFKENIKSKEAVIVIMSGFCELKCDKEIFLLKRKNVFDEKASALYIPKGLTYEIFAKTYSEIALCKAPSDKTNKPVLITPNDIEVKVVGKGNFLREIHNIAVTNINAEKLLVGETFNQQGCWSSYPPHKHDRTSKDEVKLEEIYHFKVRPEQGFGMMRIYTDDREIDQTYTIFNNDTIVIPKGYHSVVAAPGYSLYYLWILAGDKRIIKQKDDPTHAWIKYE